MTWQEELRQLDADLAAGRLSSDDYRVRRDAVLAKAASGDSGLPSLPVLPAAVPAAPEPITQLPLPPAPTPPPPVAAPISAPVPVPQVSQEKPSDGPFPPAFKWKDDTPAVESTTIIPPITDDTPPPPGLPVGERTQTVQTVRPQEPQPDRTQVVRNPEQLAQQAPAQQQADRTQVVSSSEMRTVTTSFPPQPQPQQLPQPQQPQQPAIPQSWNQQRPVESAPPWWVGEEVPDLGNSTGWQQDAFATDTKSGRGRTVLLVIVAIIVVLGIATAAFFVGKSVGESKSTSAGYSRTAY
ncbi:hypothetical protein [Actinokineospora diospyrosa]|uniref:Oligomerization/nucleic acid binding protein n=1 Tax=Actinokineospora diospyrosa TaxID=103728 RepID=A0ABT1ICV6_9PSEU|nr:hypothetical protein [Actinokineospora diospyrosa]MCP2270461.1 hypothetical protein [Actinokineospora diospyrosa]